MTKRITASQIRARKGAEKITVLTAYTAPFAAIIDPHVDMLLVGDSLGMVVYGFDSTLPVTTEMMIAHGRAVVNASAHAMVVVDMPFLSHYQASREQAFAACARVMAETGCGAVKLEGGIELADTIQFLSERGIPVLAHVGLMPQRVHALGGYRSQGKNEAEKRRIIADAKAVAQAGAFAVVVEAVREPIAREVTAQVEIPIIGIGASAACDGQVLVVDDMAGITAHSPGFVKRYADIGAQLEGAVKRYVADVKSGAFPSEEHIYGAKTPDTKKIY